MAIASKDRLRLIETYTIEFTLPCGARRRLPIPADDQRNAWRVAKCVALTRGWVADKSTIELVGTPLAKAADENGRIVKAARRSDRLAQK